MAQNRSVPERVRSRLGWIEACLRWAGRFEVREKAAYRDVFGLTDGMVSRDQAAFLNFFNEKAGVEVLKNHRGKLVFATSERASAATCFPEPDLLRWLEGVLGRSGFVDVPPIHRASPRPEVLQPVISGILGRQPLQFRYRSRRGEDALRILSPHVVVHVANRLHLRGWDHDRNAARDFLLTRMREVRLAADAVTFVAQDIDRDWWEEVEVEIALRAGEDFEAVRADFALDESATRLRRVRKAYAHYLMDLTDPAAPELLQSPVVVRRRLRSAPKDTRR